MNRGDLKINIVPETENSNPGIGKNAEKHEVAHLSQENNTPDLALSTVRSIVQQQYPKATIQFYVTSQDEVVKNKEWEDYHEQNIFE